MDLNAAFYWKDVMEPNCSNSRILQGPRCNHHIYERFRQHFTLQTDYTIILQIDYRQRSAFWQCFDQESHKEIRSLSLSLSLSLFVCGGSVWDPLIFLKLLENSTNTPGVKSCQSSQESSPVSQAKLGSTLPCQRCEQAQVRKFVQ